MYKYIYIYNMFLNRKKFTRKYAFGSIEIYNTIKNE